jgi:hypothetical protein
VLRKIALGCLALGLVIVVTSRPAAAFDNASLHGWYAFRFGGVMGGNAVVGSGVLRFFLDAAGQPKVAGRASWHGFTFLSSCQGTVRDGLYGVQMDGTAFMSANFFPDCGTSGEVMNFHLVIVNDGNGFEMMSIANGGRLWGTATRRGAGPHAAADLAGSFGFQAVSIEPSFEQILQGVLVLDGAGLLIGGRVQVLHGGVTRRECVGNVMLQGNSTYSVNPNGTGTLALAIQYDDPNVCAGSDLWFLSIAIFRGGRGFEIASIAQGRLFGRATRQEPVEP